MLTGRGPFFNENKDIMIEKIKTKEADLPSYISDCAKDIIRRLIDKNPAERLGSTDGANEVKAHPFFQNIDWKKLYKKQVMTPPVDFPEPSMCSFTEEFFSRNSSISSW